MGNGDGMRIERGFDDGDRAEVARLYWQAFGAKLARVMGPADRALSYFEGALVPGHAFCARDASGRLLGVAGFKTVEGALVRGSLRDMARVYGWFGALWRAAALSALEHEEESRRFLMDGIFVAPGARGQGVGSRLLEAVAQEAAARGYDEMRLDVVDSNLRARALYERRGFRAVESRSTGLLRHVFSFRSATTMVRRLTP